MISLLKKFFATKTSITAETIIGLAQQQGEPIRRRGNCILDVIAKDVGVSWYADLKSNGVPKYNLSPEDCKALEYGFEGWGNYWSNPHYAVGKKVARLSGYYN